MMLIARRQYAVRRASSALHPRRDASSLVLNGCRRKRRKRTHDVVGAVEFDPGEHFAEVSCSGIARSPTRTHWPATADVILA